MKSNRNEPGQAPEEKNRNSTKGRFNNALAEFGIGCLEVAAAGLKVTAGIVEGILSVPYVKPALGAVAVGAILFHIGKSSLASLIPSMPEFVKNIPQKVTDGIDTMSKWPGQIKDNAVGAWDGVKEKFPEIDMPDVSSWKRSVEEHGRKVLQQFENEKPVSNAIVVYYNEKADAPHRTFMGIAEDYDDAEDAASRLCKDSPDAGPAKGCKMAAGVPAGQDGCVFVAQLPPGTSKRFGDASIDVTVSFSQMNEAALKDWKSEWAGEVQNRFDLKEAPVVVNYCSKRNAPIASPAVEQP